MEFNDVGTQCQHNPKRLAHLSSIQNNVQQSEMKTSLLEILYSNPFAGLDHEDLYIHLTKFYEITSILEVSDVTSHLNYLIL